MTDQPCDVHESAVVDEGAEIGEGTKVWHFTHVMPGARIGRECMLGQNVFVAAGVLIGDRVRIQNNVSVYEGVVLDDEVFVGPSVVFTNVHHPRSGVSRQNQYQRTAVHRGVTLGANCTVVCGNSIGEYAFIAAGAVVTKPVPPYALMTGVPARQAGWVCACGAPLKETDRGSCPECHRQYRERGPKLEPKPEPLSRA